MNHTYISNLSPIVPPILFLFGLFNGKYTCRKTPQRLCFLSVTHSSPISPGLFDFFPQFHHLFFDFAPQKTLFPTISPSFLHILHILRQPPRRGLRRCGQHLEALHAFLCEVPRGAAEEDREEGLAMAVEIWWLSHPKSSHPPILKHPRIKWSQWNVEIPYLTMVSKGVFNIKGMGLYMEVS